MGSWSFRTPQANLAALLLGAACLLGAAPSGTIYVTTLPSGADVWLDGSYVGRSPVVVGALSAGAHHLTLSRTGWSPANFSVSVAAGETETTSVVLTRETDRVGDATGTIALHADGKIDAVSVDGAPAVLGKDDTIEVRAGTHQISVLEPQGRATRTVTVYPQTRTEVVLHPDAELHSVVVAPADDYLPASAYRLAGSRLIVRYGGHVVVANLGATNYDVDHHPATYDAPPQLIQNRLYLPLDLLTLLTAKK